MTKKKVISWGVMIGIVIGFLLFFASFTTTTATNLYLSVDYENSNGWEITGLEDGKEMPLTATAAIDTAQTVFLRRIATEDWGQYPRIEVDTGRAVAVFVGEQLVFANHETDISKPQALPLMTAPQSQLFSTVFSFDPAWVGQEITLVSRCYENAPYASIGFQLVGEAALLLQHEAWVNGKTIVGVSFAILALLFFGIFLFQFATSKKGYPILLLGCASFLQMLCYMSVLSGYPLPVIDSGFAMAVYFLFPLLYIGTKIMGEKRKYFISIIGIWSVYFMVYVAVYVLHLPLPYWFDKTEMLCFVLLGIALYYVMKQRRTNGFMRRFLQLFLAFFSGYGLLFLLSLILERNFHSFVFTLLREARAFYVRPFLFWVYTTILLVLFLLVLWEVLEEYKAIAKEVTLAEGEKALLYLQMDTAKSQMEALRKAYEQTAMYRHDMRHHISLLSGFATEGDLEGIKGYLVQTTRDIGDMTFIRYCENEAVHLILAAFVEKAGAVGVSVQVDASLPRVVALSDTALCSLLSNGLENAIMAASKCKAEARQEIAVDIHIKGENLLISIKNPVVEPVFMAQGIPVPKEPQLGHGLGVKSMIAIVQRYGGIYSFTTEGAVFTLRLVVPVKKKTDDIDKEEVL